MSLMKVGGSETRRGERGDRARGEMNENSRKEARSCDCEKFI